MTWAVERHPLLEQDIDECAAFIYSDNPEAAFRFLDAVETTFEALSENPLLGTLAGFEHADLRDFRRRLVNDFHNYLIFYRPNHDAERVEVFALLQGARDLPRHLSSRAGEPWSPGGEGGA